MATTRGHSRRTTVSLFYLDNKARTRTETRIEIDAEDEKKRLTTHESPTKDDAILTTKAQQVSTTDSFDQKSAADFAPRTTLSPRACKRPAAPARTKVSPR